MKKLLFVAVALMLLPRMSAAQQLSSFVRSAPLSASAEMHYEIPANFFEGRVLTPLYDTTLGSRIIGAMNTTYAKTRTFGKHGIAVSVIIPGRPQWSGAIGTDDLSTPMDTGLAFEVASNTKTFVAALIMLLQDSGKLLISDSIGKWLPKPYPNVDGSITIEQLLSHASGIYDYLNDDPNAIVYEQFFLNPTKLWPPDSILMNHVGKPNFKKGTSYRYSNTNFLLAAMIAERAGGEALGKQIHRHFIDKLHLSRTYFGGDDSIPLPFAHNWTYGDSSKPDYDFFGIEKTGLFSGSWGVGNIVSVPTDLARWSNTLYTGQLLSKSAFTQMTKVHAWPDGSAYGLGTAIAPYYSNRILFGHGGSLAGFKSFEWTNAKDSVSIALYLNSDSAPNDPVANDYALDILGEVYRVVKGVKRSDRSPLQMNVFPNPTSDKLTFTFEVNNLGNVKLSLFNLMGEAAAVVVNESLPEGFHHASVDASGLPAGTYFYRLESRDGMVAGKVVVR
ncbi:MAG: serine hydrolase [bacterium]